MNVKADLNCCLQMIYVIFCWTRFVYEANEIYHFSDLLNLCIYHCTLSHISVICTLYHAHKHRCKHYQRLHIVRRSRTCETTQFDQSCLLAYSLWIIQTLKSEKWRLAKFFLHMCRLMWLCYLHMVLRSLLTRCHFCKLQ